MPNIPLTGQNTQSINYLNSATKDRLAVLYGEIIDMIQSQAISMKLKNTTYSGEVTTGGSIVVRRLNTAIVRAYGTARAAAQGDKLTNNGVEVFIDQRREIVEEMEINDVQKYGIPGLLEKRKNNQALAIIRELDNAFFLQAQTAAATIDLTSKTTLVDKVELFIQTMELLTNTNVDKVDRDMMVLTLHPLWYGAFRNYLDTLANPTNGGVDIRTFHGVEVISAPRQGVDAILQVKGSVAQPVTLTPYDVERIPLSNAVGLETFLFYGTKAVTPDLIMKAALDPQNNISA